MEGLARSLQGMGRINEAVKLHEETLKFRKSVLGPEHPDVFWSMEELANSLLSLGRSQAARQLYEEILTGRRKLLGEDHPHTLRALQYLTHLNQPKRREHQMIKCQCGSERG
jgi:tetratricopeptide (TPR) repeat protein